MASGSRKRISRAGPPPRNINGQFEQITVVVLWLIFLQLSCHKVYDIVFPRSNHCCHAIILHGCCKQSLIYMRQEILEMTKIFVFGDLETSQIQKTFSSIISVTW